MAKRKRDDDTQEEGEVVGAKQRRVQYKLKQGITKLGHAFKVAKGFERQKLGRRMKTAAAQSNSKDVDRIDSEIAALKALDTSTAAQHHLCKTLLKNKSIAEHPDLSSEVRNPSKLPSDVATLNVNARLCKSNQVKEALAAAIDDIQHTLGIETERSASTKKRRVRAHDFDNIAPEPSAVKRDGQSDKGDPSLLPTKNQSPGLPNDSADDPKGIEDEVNAFEGRIGSSSDVDSDIEMLEQQPTTGGARKGTAPALGYDVEADLSIPGSENGSHSDSTEPQKAPMPKKSSFLPALTIGGYISGSGSDIDDDVDSAFATKRNRRGQRARQQIWEQKYGSTAKHLQKPNRDNGWDPKRGATNGSERYGKGRMGREARSGPNPNVRSRPGQTESKSGNQTKTKHRDDGGPIHPSWEAAKRAKEKKDAPVAFQGKKITFD